MDKQQTQRDDEYLALLNNIPGGVQQCLNDDSYTMVEINQGFIEMFGFSREELRDRFQNRFADMIHPSDRESVMREVAEQLRGGKVELTYRVLCKDGQSKWVMDNGQLVRGADGGERVFCVLLDVTESREAREELRLSLERHEIIMDQTNDIIFEWNLREDTMALSPNWMKKFGYPPRYEGMEHPKAAFRHIHPDDISPLVEMMEAMKQGNPYASIEARIQDIQGQFIWCRIRATDLFDEASKPLKAVGVITDIDKEKRMIDDLRRRAERDALTGLYNREETERQIRRHLRNRPETLCALFMIDTDNFKLVNDRQGHLFGDAVLTELAAGMKKLTRQSDVVGRIGGDEFTIFLKDLPTREIVMEKAAGLIDTFRHLFQGEKQLIEVTCSVGVAVYPEDGDDFQSLYHSADLALYQAKSRGKNQYALSDRQASMPVEQMEYSSLGAAIDSDQQTAGISSDLVRYVFQILYDASDIVRAIQLILEIVGKRFDVSRAYIFENSEDGAYADNTYEWCNDGIEPQKEQLQHYPYDSLFHYEELFRDDSVFYCRDIHALPPSEVALFEAQGVCSTLQCAIREGKLFRGFVGFDECTGKRMWTKEEISMLTLISKLLTIFLQNKRVTDRDKQIAAQLAAILDTQDAYIYAVEQESLHLLYINRKTRELDPEVSTGMTCYSAFFSRSTPCESCPLSGGGGEIYNSKYGLWTKVRVAPMKWAEHDAYLLSCFDITEYKQGDAGKGAAACPHACG